MFPFCFHFAVVLTPEIICTLHCQFIDLKAISSVASAIMLHWKESSAGKRESSGWKQHQDGDQLSEACFSVRRCWKMIKGSTLFYVNVRIIRACCNKMWDNSLLVWVYVALLHGQVKKQPEAGTTSHLFLLCKCTLGWEQHTVLFLWPWPPTWLLTFSQTQWPVGAEEIFAAKLLGAQGFFICPFL